MSEPETKQSLDGKPAGIIRLICPTCHGNTWELLGSAPPGAVHGQLFAKGDYAFNTVECCACGEQFTFEYVR